MYPFFFVGHGFKEEDACGRGCRSRFLYVSYQVTGKVDGCSSIMSD